MKTTVVVFTKPGGRFFVSLGIFGSRATYKEEKAFDEKMGRDYL